ncbi:MAG: GIDE domain-containing protein [Propionivibrio sp.]
MFVSLRKSYGQFITSGAQLALLIIGLQTESSLGWIACLALIALVSLFAWMSTLRRRRAITDTPTSRIASAAQGYVELLGKGRPLDSPPLLSHLTHLPCLWYRYQVEEKTNNKWETVSRGESEVPFIIDDGSGRCVVDVEGAEILTRHKETWTEGHYRNTEWKLLINDDVYALGDFKTLGGGSVDLDARQDMNDLLAEWKKDQPGLLKRFDLNGDGTIDMQEWGLARQAARREVARMHRDARNESDVHTLSCPRNGRHYLLSNLDPNKLARRYLLWASFHLMAFLASLGAIPWVLHRGF